MTIETQKNFLGKTQTILMAEIESERWSSWIRLGIAVGYSLLAFYSYSVDDISVRAFALQMGAVLTMLAYSGYYLTRYSTTRARTYSSFILVILDVLVITTVLVSYSLMGAPSALLCGSLFSVYFIAIIFTALHNKLSLSIFSGVFSAVCYSAYYLYIFLFKGGPTDTWISDFSIRVVLLLIVAAIAGIISRKNYATINKVISSEQRYQNLVHRLPEMLFTLDERGKFLWSNNTSFALLGLPAKVLPGRNIKDFLAQPGQLKIDKAEFKGTIQIKDLNGRTKYVDCTLQPTSEVEKPLIYEGIMTDVSDRELALSQREEMVTRLHQYQKMESLGTLASGMAHDFNNILQTVDDITVQVQKDTAEPETKKRMEVVSETLVEAKLLISELLALGRNKLLDYKNIHLQGFFEDIIPLYGSQLGSKFQVVFKAPDEPLWIQGDDDYFKRVFQNLIGNSRDAMENGGTITIECFADRRHGEKTGTVVIRFTDTGTGIPHEVLDKIFDPFFTTKKKGKGTGLGLALVQRIVSLHNGRVFVERTDKRGTTFRIEIPESEGGEVEHDTTMIMLNRTPSMVLLLDDDPKIRAILRFFMNEFKYAVCEASTVEEGARELNKHLAECEVLIMDWKLGRDDPHAAIARLRAIKPSLIVIVVSGYPPEQKSVEDMKIWKWFTKPYDKNQLDLEIQKALFYAKKGSKKAGKQGNG
ncbi:MAG TPA: ATP-binding protein [Chitinivibrionales bacterium]|nr:ATP-binding protein [Chitinivibrionales bacterium]